MSTSADFILALAAMALASYACRAGGFAAMRYVRATPRLEAALRAVPLSVMIGIVAPSLGTAGPAEWIGLAAVALAMRLTSNNDPLAAMIGVATVAAARALGL